MPIAAFDVRALFSGSRIRLRELSLLPFSSLMRWRTRVAGVAEGLEAENSYSLIVLSIDTTRRVPRKDASDKVDGPPTLVPTQCR